MQETKITVQRIRHHFNYSWWKYALMACLVVFGWNLVYTSSAYRPPRDKRLDITFVSHPMPEDFTGWVKDETLARYPDIEDANITSIVLTPEDSYYGTMQMTTYIGAGEGDVYVLPKEQFDSLVQNMAFVPLNNAIADGTIALDGMDTASGIRTDEEGQTAVFGIPLDSLYGFMEHGIDNRGLYAVVMSYSPNQERAADWIGWLAEAMRGPKPQWLVEQEAKHMPEAEEVSEISSY